MKTRKLLTTVCCLFLFILVNSCSLFGGNDDDRNKRLQQVGLLALLAQAGTVTGIYQIIQEQTLTANSTTISFTGLNGDTDIEYLIVARVVGVSACTMQMTLNGDTGTNYGSQSMFVANTAVTASSLSNQTKITLGQITNGDAVFLKGHLYAKSGAERFFSSQYMYHLGNTAIQKLEWRGNVWNNSADSITTIELGGAGICYGAGTHVELWARR